MSLWASIKEFYGNRGVGLDFLVSLALVVGFFYFHVPLEFIKELTDDKSEAVISFFGVLVGFLLTSFSLLFLYNPDHSEELKRLRQHKAYKKMLYSFVSTSFFIIVFCVVFLVSSLLIYHYLVLFFLSFVILRILKCLYYLYVVVSIS